MVTGESGRGKSTLLYLLGLLLTPTSGDVLLSDVSTGRLRDSQRASIRARRIGFVFQDASLDLSRTILDSVIEPALYAGLNRGNAIGRGEQLLKQLDVAHRFDHRPGEISGGQAQRVAVCRALINSPDVVLADEPTGNLDSDNADIVLDTLRSEARTGRTIVVATHDIRVVETADEVLRL